MTNGREGVTTADEQVAKILYKTKKPVVLAVNKVDNPDMREMIQKKFIKQRICFN